MLPETLTVAKPDRADEAEALPLAAVDGVVVAQGDNDAASTLADVLTESEVVGAADAVLAGALSVADVEELREARGDGVSVTVERWEEDSVAGAVARADSLTLGLSLDFGVNIGDTESHALRVGTATEAVAVPAVPDADGKALRDTERDSSADIDNEADGELEREVDGLLVSRAVKKEDAEAESRGDSEASPVPAAESDADREAEAESEGDREPRELDDAELDRLLESEADAEPDGDRDANGDADDVEDSRGDCEALARPDALLLANADAVGALLAEPAPEAETVTDTFTVLDTRAVFVSPPEAVVPGELVREAASETDARRDGDSVSEAVCVCESRKVAESVAEEGGDADADCEPSSTLGDERGDAVATTETELVADPVLDVDAELVGEITAVSEEEGRAEKLLFREDDADDVSAADCEAGALECGVPVAVKNEDGEIDELRVRVSMDVAVFTAVPLRLTEPLPDALVVFDKSAVSEGDAVAELSADALDDALVDGDAVCNDVEVRVVVGVCSCVELNRVEADTFGLRVRAPDAVVEAAPVRLTVGSTEADRGAEAEAARVDVASTVVVSAADGDFVSAVDPLTDRDDGGVIEALV